VKLLKYVIISILAGFLYADNGYTEPVQVSTADVEVLTSMAVRQAVATWKPVEVSNGPYHVKVTPRSKTRLPNCALLHRVVRKQGKIVRDHLLKKCDDEVK
jgi:uncharacterized protein (UPF0262 family)